VALPGRAKGLWKERFAAITSWERHLHASGTRVVKFFLHVSKAEQRERFEPSEDEQAAIREAVAKLQAE
jgi:polyphosphate kinase 2 (PPK2 family)